MNTKIEPYQYQSIQDNDGIRLIQLQPSKSSDSIIRCDLIHTRLRTVKQDIFEHYTALSYVWGDATQTTQIMVGEKTLEVTKSLDSALRHLRDERRVLNIWADGVCINQNDDEGEKGRQVQQMGKVYETADHTVIFLGECDAKTEEALSGVVDWLEEDSLAFDSKINQDGIRIVQELLGRPWFTRVWVYQELVMSRDPWVQYGRARFPWSLFCQFTSRLYGEIAKEKFQRSKDSYDLVYNSTEKIVRQMEQSRSDFLGAKLTPKDTFDQHKSDAIMAGISRFHQLVAKRAGYTKLLEILVSRKGFGASDPRDLVFSILGLSSQVDIQADYGITTPDLYQTVAWNFMDLHWSLEILSHVEDVDLSARMPGLASWAPDWTAVHQPGRRIRIMSKPSDYTYDSTVSGPREYDDNSRPFYVTRSLTKHNSLWCKAYRISKVRQLSSTIENLGAEGVFKHNSLQAFRNPMDILTYKPFSKVAWDEIYYDWWRTWLGPEQSILPSEPSSLNANNSSTSNSILPIAESLKPSSKSQTYESSIDVSGVNSRRRESKVLRYLVKRLQQPYAPSILDGRKLARLDNDQLAVVPSSTNIGDHVYLLHSCPVPFVLRKAPRDLAKPDRGVAQIQRRIANASGQKQPHVVHSTLIGECYVDGWMHEELSFRESRPRMVGYEEYNKLLVIS